MKNKSQFTQEQLARIERISKAVQSARKAIFEEIKTADNTMPPDDFMHVALLLSEMAVTGEDQITKAECYEITKVFLKELVAAIKPQPAQRLM